MTINWPVEYSAAYLENLLSSSALNLVQFGMAKNFVPLTIAVIDLTFCKT